ncbi:hypothetical protein VTL71DRAFT_13005 [Oculimacula yallundae]|uniref:NmrA-like domain-containing protein n=1 Tax=Oculimacula yallundae TaxID=86028 RepID=A0ABR4CPK3_9HELO
MASKGLVVVLGSTSGQGRSVVRRLLRSGRYDVRGITRDVNSKEAQELVKQGAQVVEGSLDDPKSLLSAFQTAQVIFAVTKMVDGNMAQEVNQGKNIANAAAAITCLKKFIWSTLPSAVTVSDGKIKVPHMDGKAQVDEYIIETKPDLAVKTTFLWGGFYAENVRYPNFKFNSLGGIDKQVWIQPIKADTLVPMVGDHNTNIGIVVERILARPDECPSKAYVLAITEWLAHGDLLHLWAKLVAEKLGRKIEPVYVQSDLDTVDQLWPGIGKEMGLLLKVLELLGKDAWTKEGATIVSMDDLGLKVGAGDGDLVGTHAAVRRLLDQTDVQDD